MSNQYETMPIMGGDDFTGDDLPFVSREPPRNQIVDNNVYDDVRAQTTSGQILSNIQIIGRLSAKPSAADIIHMITKAKEVRELADALVAEMEELRLGLLRELGIEV